MSDEKELKATVRLIKALKLLKQNKATILNASPSLCRELREIKDRNGESRYRAYFMFRWWRIFGWFLHGHSMYVVEIYF